MVPVVAELTARAAVSHLYARRRRFGARGKTTTGIINDSHPTTAHEENDPSLRARCSPLARCHPAAPHSHYLARLLHAVQLSSLEIAVLALVMDICHGGDTRYRALPPTKKRRGGIIDDARARATPDQIFTTPTSLDVYNFRANEAARCASRRVIRIERARVRQVIPLHSPPPVWFREYFSP